MRLSQQAQVEIRQAFLNAVVGKDVWIRLSDPEDGRQVYAKARVIKVTDTMAWVEFPPLPPPIPEDAPLPATDEEEEAEQHTFDLRHSDATGKRWMAASRIFAEKP